MRSDRPEKGQRADRALARPRPLSRCLRPRRRLQPTARPARRRGHRLHPRTRHRAALLSVAGFAVHRPLPAEQRAAGIGPSRLGVPGRRPHAPADPVGSGLAYSAFRYAARDLVPGPAWLRRIRCVQFVLRVRGRALRRVARQSTARAVSVDCRLLRDPPPVPG